jgi:glycerophosphoryl diester phosphodiesterase
MSIWPFPRIVAHRGGGTLAPENTLAGMRCAALHGFHAVEFDVMLAQDGVPVVIHDTRLGRTVAGDMDIASLPSAQLGAMDAGSWFGSGFRGDAGAPMV